MKLGKPHILILFLLLFCNFELSVGLTIQEPDYLRRFDHDFKTKYQSDIYDYNGKAIVTSTPSGSGEYQEYKKDKLRQREKNNRTQYSINLGPLSWLFYAAILLAVGYLFYILFNEGSSGLFSSRKQRVIPSFDHITTENIENTDIEKLIAKAEKEGNYRIAIRYYYLHVLKTLSLKNHIKLEDDKTNSEYLNETLSKPFGKNFKQTSYIYNYIWYGEFQIDSQKYNTAKTHFIDLLKQVNK